MQLPQKLLCAVNYLAGVAGAGKNTAREEESLYVERCSKSQESHASAKTGLHWIQ